MGTGLPGCHPRARLWCLGHPWAPLCSGWCVGWLGVPSLVLFLVSSKSSYADTELIIITSEAFNLTVQLSVYDYELLHACIACVQGCIRLQCTLGAPFKDTPLDYFCIHHHLLSGYSKYVNCIFTCFVLRPPLSLYILSPVSLKPSQSFTSTCAQYLTGYMSFNVTLCYHSICM